MILAAVSASVVPAFSGDDADSFFNLIQSRRSVRDYLPTPVPKDHILKILDAARMAPTSGNQQPWKFLVVQDRDKLNQLLEEQVRFRVQAGSQGKTLTDAELAALKEKSRTFALRYLSAPVFIVVLTDSQSTYPGYNHWDGPLAVGYLMLAARSLGYGTVFITDGLDFGVIRKTLAIPDRYEIVCATPLGVPKQWPEMPPKKPLESFIVFESFGK
jgi:nitroreductase